MKKSKAIELLGGTVASAAASIGITSQAITQWPDELPNRLTDRVYAAIARKSMPNSIDLGHRVQEHRDGRRLDAADGDVVIPESHV